jgi:hypothetical protein
VTETATFVCSICNEPSTEICVYCTKDTCGNHRCERCKRCSDCCECEVPLTGPEPNIPESLEPEAPILASAIPDLQSLGAALDHEPEPAHEPGSAHEPKPPIISLEPPPIDPVS